MSAQVIHGDCLEELGDLPSASIDAVVTDPPYGLSFMGKRWDYDVPSEDIWRECLRVLKPGGHLLAFAGTRTQHRMAVRIEDAGFEIRDMIAWVYATGFPKSHNLDGEWDGWGTALKPSLEPITVARKPFAGTVAANVRQFGTGALNIEGCRVETGDGYIENAVIQGVNTARTSYEHRRERRTFVPSQAGRWPANLIHDGSEEVLALFPESTSGAVKAGTLGGHSRGREVYGEHEGYSMPAIEASAGSAARFFYCAKASSRDRHEGLKHPGPQFKQGTTLRKVENTVTRGNTHPTVKPTDLMRYLCRLVTPPGGLVLDPFCGSGSTGKAALLEGFSFIGIEREREYVEIARARLAAVQPALLGVS